MSWRIVVITGHSKLEEKLGYLCVRDSDGVKKIHLSEISILMVESTAVSLTASLLCELSNRKVKVIFCDAKRNPQSELMSYNGRHNSSLTLKQQIAWDEHTKDAVWTCIVSEKIRKQAELLECCGRKECEMLYKYVSEIEPGDKTNREGHAAKVYFNALFGMDFSRQSNDGINAALDYGYSLILSAFNREVVSLGYTTKLGLFHDNMFNGYNLSCDLMEPFRPLVDKKVISFASAGSNFQLTKSEKMEIINVLNDEVVIDGKRQIIVNAIKVYCKSVTDALTCNDATAIRFYGNE